MKAREIGDPQGVGPALCTRARAVAAAGRRSEADELVHELVERRFTELWVPELPLAFVELGHASAYGDAIADTPTTVVWRQAGLAAAAGDLTDAAEIYERIGARFCEAWARLLAAEAGDATQVDRARRYFEDQNATAFARRCEALLPAST